eukprot:c21802_g1_i1 orf=441-1088(-)
MAYSTFSSMACSHGAHFRPPSRHLCSALLNARTRDGDGGNASPPAWNTRLFLSVFMSVPNHNHTSQALRHSGCFCTKLNSTDPGRITGSVANTLSKEQRDSQPTESVGTSEQGEVNSSSSSCSTDPKLLSSTADPISSENSLSSVSEEAGSKSPGFKPFLNLRGWYEDMIDFLTPREKGDSKDMILMSLSLAVYVYISQKLVCAYCLWKSMGKNL